MRIDGLVWFHDLSKPVFIPLYGTCSLNLVADISHWERIQRLATTLVTRMCTLLYEAWPLFLLAVMISGWSDYRIQGIHDSIRCGSKLQFSLSHSMRRQMTPQGKTHRLRRGSTFSVMVVKYWDKLPAFSVNIFKKRLNEAWTEVFQHLSHWMNTHLPNTLTPPLSLNNTH